MDLIKLNGKTYINTRKAAKLFGYANDYIGQLCRAGKVDCTRIGRSWYVTEESLAEYKREAAQILLEQNHQVHPYDYRRKEGGVVAGASAVTDASVAASADAVTPVAEITTQTSQISVAEVAGNDAVEPIIEITTTAEVVRPISATSASAAVAATAAATAATAASSAAKGATASSPVIASVDPEMLRSEIFNAVDARLFAHKALREMGDAEEVLKTSRTMRADAESTRNAVLASKGVLGRAITRATMRARDAAADSVVVRIAKTGTQTTQYVLKSTGAAANNLGRTLASTFPRERVQSVVAGVLIAALLITSQATGTLVLAKEAVVGGVAAYADAVRIAIVARTALRTRINNLSRADIRNAGAYVAQLSTATASAVGEVFEHAVMYATREADVTYTDLVALRELGTSKEAADAVHAVVADAHQNAAVATVASAKAALETGRIAAHSVGNVLNDLAAGAESVFSTIAADFNAMKNETADSIASLGSVDTAALSTILGAAGTAVGTTVGTSSADRVRISPVRSFAVGFYRAVHGLFGSDSVATNENPLSSTVISRVQAVNENPVVTAAGKNTTTAKIATNNTSVQRVVERVVNNNTTERVIVGEISRAEFDAKIQQLSDIMAARFANLSTGSGGSITNVYQTISQMNRIDTLSRVSISDANITGGSISGASISGTWSGGVIAQQYGGTGTSTYSAGDILYADANGTLKTLSIGAQNQVLTVKSGIPAWAASAGGGGGGASAWATSTDNLLMYPVEPTQVVVVGGSATTSTGNIFEVIGSSKLGGVVTANQILATGSSTLQDVTFQNATGTAATTTSFFASILNGITSIFSSLTSGTATVGDLTATSSATLSYTGANMLISTDATGKLVSTSTPQVAAINATSSTATSTFTNVSFNQSELGTVLSGTWRGTAIGQAYGGTGFSSYTAGDILYADGSGNLAKLPAASNGMVLKLNAGIPSWQTDLTTGGGGGSTAWSTTTDSLAIYPTDTTDVLIVGAMATTTTGNILEVVGNSKLGGLATITNLLVTGSSTFQNFTASNSTTTNATSTSFFASILNGITSTLSSASIGSATIGTLTATSTATSSFVGGLYATLISAPYFHATSSTATSTFAGGVQVNKAINVAAGSGYMLNGASLATASTTLNNYFFGEAGNLTMTGNKNVGVGYHTLSTVSSGSQNTAVGHGALSANSTGISNTAVGYNALLNGTGSNNTALGLNSLNASSNAGSQNTALGGSTLSALTSGLNNVAVGYHAGFTLDVGSNNTFIGVNAGDSQTAGSGNIIIGYNIDAASTTGSNQLDIGNLIYGVNLGASGSTVSTGFVGIGSTTPFTRFVVNGNSYFEGNTTATGTGVFAGLVVNGSTTAQDITATNLLATGSSTFQNFTASNSTTTNATSTSFFASILNGITSILSSLTSGSATIGTLTATSTATLSYTGANMLISTDATGKLVSSSTPQVRSINATSTVATSTFAGGLNVAGTSGLTVLQGGKVGIGTVAPDYQLTVQGTVAGDVGMHVSNLSPAGFAINVFTNNLGGSAYFGTGGSIMSSSGIPFSDRAYVQSLNGRGVSLVSDSGDIRMFVGTELSGDYAERMRIDVDGRVGVATSAPWGILSVNATSSQTNFPIFVVASTTAAFSTSTAFIVDANGKVGVGTSSPSQQLSVAGNGYLTGTLTATNLLATGSSTFQDFTASNSTTTNATSTSFFASIMNGITSILSSLTSGSATIGTLTATSSATLSYTGANMLISTDATGKLVSSSTPTAAAYLATSTTATSTFLGGLSVAGATGLTVLQNGNVGIGTTTSEAALEVARSGDQALIYSTVYSPNENAYQAGIVGRKATGTRAAPTATLAGSNLLALSGRGYTGSAFSSTANALIAFQTEETFSAGAQGTAIQFETTPTGSATRNFTMILTGSGRLGIGTTTPWRKLSVYGSSDLGTNALAGSFTATTTATSTFVGGILTDLLSVGSTTATSTFANGIQLTAGCFRLPDGSCAGSGTGVSGGTTGMLTAWTSSTGLTATGTPTATAYIATSTIATSTFAGGLTVAGTSGLSILQDGKVAIGGTNPTGKLSVTLNSSGFSTPEFASQNVMHLVGADGTDVIAQTDVFGGHAVIDIRRANGTMASPSALITNDEIGAFSFRGYADATSYATGGGRAAVTAYAAENWSSTNMGSYLLLSTTPLGSTALSTGMKIGPDGVSGNNSDFGVGTFVPNVFGYNPSIQRTLTILGGQNVGSRAVLELAARSDNNVSGSVIGQIDFNAQSQSSTKRIAMITGLLTGSSAGDYGSDIAIYTKGDGSSSVSEKFRINSAGNVGIGTSSPYAKLSVVGQVVGAYFTATTTATSTFTGGLSVGLLNVSSTTATSTFANGIQLTAGCFRLPDGSCAGSGGSLSGGAANGIAFWTGASTLSNNTNFIWDNANTRFGLSTTSPWAVLSVAASSTNPGNIPLLVISTSTASATSTAVIVDANGKFGVGTSSPYAQASVQGLVAAQNFNADATTSTSTFAGGLNVGNGSLLYDWNSGTTSIPYLEMGNLSFAPDSGAVSWMDMSVTSASVAGAVQSYSANINSNPILTIYGESDGAGGVRPNLAVGIGTSTPLHQLDVLAGSTTPFATGKTTNYFGINIDNQATSSTASIIKAGLGITSTGSWAGSGASNIGLYVYNVAGGTNNYDAIFNGGGTVGIGTTSPFGRLSIAGASLGTAPLLLLSTSTASATSTAFMIDANGKVGVGTTSPYAQLSVAGLGAFDFINTNATTSTSTIAGGLSVGSGALSYDFSSGITSVAGLQFSGMLNFDTDAGVVGWADLPISSALGGAAQSYTAHIGGNPVLTVYGESDGAGASRNLRVGIGSTTPIATLSVNASTTAATSWAFAVADVASTTKFMIRDDGVVGVATTSPIAAFAINPIAGIAANQFVVGSSTATSFIITNSGAVGVGTTTPWRTLSVSGTVAMPSLTAAGASGSAVCIAAGGEVQVNTGAQTCTVSSIRFKENIGENTGGLNTVLALKPSSFKYKNGNGEERVGFIAEEVNQIDPRLVFLGDDGLPRGVRYEDMTSVLARSIQDLSAIFQIASTTDGIFASVRLDTIESRLAALENRVGSSTSDGSNNSVASAPAPASSQSIIDSMTAYFASIGTHFSSGLAQFQKVVVDALTVGSAAKPAGITLYDEATQAPYCMKVVNGNATTTPGECAYTESVTPSPSPSPSTSPESSPSTPDTTASTTADTIPPVISLMGSNPAEVALNSSYLDVGATATDNSNAMIIADIIENTVDTTKVGQYKVVYQAHDAAMNIATSTRIVNVFNPYAVIATTTADSGAGNENGNENQASSTPVTP